MTIVTVNQTQLLEIKVRLYTNIAAEDLSYTSVVFTNQQREKSSTKTFIPKRSTQKTFKIHSSAELNVVYSQVDIQKPLPMGEPKFRNKLKCQSLCLLVFIHEV